MSSSDFEWKDESDSIAEDYAMLKAMLKKCVDSGYKMDIVKDTAFLIRKLMDKVSASEQQKFALLIKEIVRRAKENEVPPPPPAANFDTVLPLRSATPLRDGALYNTTVIDSKNKHQDNLLLLYGPFPKELDYMAECYAAKSGLPIRIVDIGYLVASFPSDVSNLIANLAAKANTSRELIVYKNVEAMAGNGNLEETFFYYLRAIRQNGKDVQQLILSTDITYSVETRYRNFIGEKYKDAGSIQTYLKSIPFDFIPLASREKTISALRQKFPLNESEITYEVVAKDGLFLGWQGLTEAVFYCNSEDELRERIAKAREEGKPQLDAFIDAFGGACTYDFIDWRYTHKTKKKNEPIVDPNDPIFHPQYKIRRGLYDGLAGNDEIFAKVERILNYDGAPVRVKCAWAAEYAMNGGDSLNIINLPPEDAARILTERWEVAYRAVAELMRVDAGTLVFDIPVTGTLLGQCCDGGATIRMSKRYLDPKGKDNLGEGINTLLHELFHALQYKAIDARRSGDNERLGYYLVHFGVRGHITEWEKNFSRYRGGDGVEFKDYEDQVVEAEARIFAADCIEENGAFNHPRLEGL